LIRRSYGKEYKRVATAVLNQLQEASAENRGAIAGVRAIETLAYDSKARAIETFWAAELNTEKAIASAVLLADANVRKNAELLQSIARFLLYDASEDEYRAVFRTASDLCPTANALALVAEIMRGLDDSVAAQRRTAAILGAGAP
jgi:hypothetical protein